MAAQTHTEDPRTGCWEPAEGVTAEDVYELHKVELPHGADLVQLCPTDGCVNPDHQRPTFFVGADSVDELAERVLSERGPLNPDEYVNTPTPEPAPVPQAPVKRGPGRPRKHPR